MSTCRSFSPVAASVHYEVIGEGEPLLLIAGTASDGASWGPLLPLLPGRQLILIDNRGSGQTRVDGPLTHRDMVADCAALIDHLGLGAVDVVGHSLGGFLGLWLAALYPDKVRRLVTMGSGTIDARSKTIFEDLSRLYFTVPPQDFFRLLYPWLFSPGFFADPAVVTAAAEASTAYAHRQSPGDFARQIAAMNHPMDADLSTIRCPVLAIAGDGDLLAPPAAVAAAHANIPGHERRDDPRRRPLDPLGAAGRDGGGDHGVSGVDGPSPTLTSTFPGGRWGSGASRCRSRSLPRGEGSTGGGGQPQSVLASYRPSGMYSHDETDPPEPERGDARTRLLEAARDVIRRQGFAGTSIDDVCAEAEVSKGAFFHHFASKEALGVAAADFWAETTTEFFAAAPFMRRKTRWTASLAYMAFRRSIISGEIADFTCLVGTMAQEVYATYPAIRDACGASIFAHARTLEGDFAAAIAEQRSVGTVDGSQPRAPHPDGHPGGVRSGQGRQRCRSRPRGARPSRPLYSPDLQPHRRGLEPCRTRRTLPAAAAPFALKSTVSR